MMPYQGKLERVAMFLCWVTPIVLDEGTSNIKHYKLVNFIGNMKGVNLAF
jgi:hypothetical protein